MSESLVVRIDNDTCIGCTKCIEACPFDAIIGAMKQMHTVIEDHCVGCKLCLPPCPVNCIIIDTVSLSDEARLTRAKLAKDRFQLRKERRERIDMEKEQKDNDVISSDMKAIIAASIARAKQKHEQNQSE